MGHSEFFDKSEVLGKYAVKYFRCAACGFVQTEEPYWLEEAYSSAIGRIDTGILYRNLRNRQFTCALLNLLFPRAQSFLDFGAGHGIFVRLMRDRGFNFHWSDRHASNDYAIGFEHTEDQIYDCVTSFEVLEHLVEPMRELSVLMKCAPNVLVSTELVPTPTPKIAEWWYYATAGGQHISFYTIESLRVIARHFRRNLVSNGSYHLCSEKPQSPLLFRLATSNRSSQILNAIRRRPSLIEPDFRLMSG